jgi:hypothetical protein
MYFSRAQIGRSLEEIQDVHPFFGISFLAFKEVEIPIGSTESVNFSSLADEILFRHYHPTDQYDGFYQPLRTGNKAGRWVSKRYGSTSLQRITKDTFGGALLHPSQSEWGWRKDYLKFLERSLQRDRIPAFHLSVWLFRNEDWPKNVTPDTVVAHFFDAYNISSDEQRQLFETAAPVVEDDWLSKRRVDEYDLLSLLGFPPDYVPREGVSLRQLVLKETGPAKYFKYEPSERLNVLTGDNGLGKTFILEGVWWALTGSWANNALLPRFEATRDAPRLTYQLAIGTNALPSQSFRYDWKKARWPARARGHLLPGVVIYSRFDGSFSVLDPARVDPDASDAGLPVSLSLARSEVWHGLEEPMRGGKVRTTCNGLIEDWVLWQLGGTQFSKRFEALTACLAHLSPSDEDRIMPGEPERLPGNVQEIPTLQTPFGRVPIVFASAGAQRILTLAYMMVWTWYEHVRNSESIKQSPQKRLAILIDEIEAHLHPKWQRAILPGLMQVVSELWADVPVQLHIATHSPLVMASVEPFFNESTDDLHHLKLVDDEVVLEELDFHKRGTADAWLMSEVFELAHARSTEAEAAIEEAKALQLQEQPSKADISATQKKLSRVLAQDDSYWTRWRYFALKHGVDE